jgi:hypothetical protein
MLIKFLFRSSYLEQKEKDRLLEREKSIDFCDVDALEEFGVLASIPDRAHKEALFGSYVKYPSALNPKKLEASAKFFYNYAD